MDNAWGCADRDTFERLIGYIVDHDMDAFKSGLSTEMLNGNCVWLQKGTAVFLSDTAIMHGLVKIRPQGDTSEYWTNMEAAK
jgi:hypothetical protein